MKRLSDFSVQELENYAKANMRMRDKISAAKPVYSAEKLEHEYLENVSRIDRLCTFRGPSSASHRSMRVREHLDVAKSMRMTRHLPGSAGFRQELSRSIKHQRSQSARTPGRWSPQFLCLLAPLSEWLSEGQLWHEILACTANPLRDHSA